MEKRGFETLLYGPLRPFGLEDPRTGKLPFAVVQLRREDAEGKAWNLVGFQTQLKISEQIRVFRLIPGLENAEFLRFGAVHRNTYINSPELLLPTLQLKKEPRILFAGQITGTEGYVPAIAGGHIAGLNAALLALGYEPVVVPRHTIWDNTGCSEDEEGSKDKVHSGEGFEGNGKFRRKNFNLKIELCFG
jgi:methylenetetrahydrofolate--tRNA-(uracil-5-)-methyltransferase